MIKNNLKSKHEVEFEEDYVVPEVRTTTITVVDPVIEQWNGRNAYTHYKVITETTYPQYECQYAEVRRRYNDFVWLKNHLEQFLNSKNWKRPVEKIPDLPGDTFASFFGWGRFEPDFIENRREKLEIFLNEVANHPQCATDLGLIRFLKEENIKPVIEFFSL
eukprot:TRINITY_DN4290_c0_g1_i1.p1 TRINITY_DN4290_c0_g1~~TRINITY_DN4290_c0_g1_i1.p1  ORF type:complete len:162 (-),score=45.59 TRINITY_DN4290_c0_g1_i1:206-691(-)